MKLAVRVTGIHFLLVALLGMLGNMDSASWCSGTCDTVSYFCALAFLFFVYPGLMLVLTVTFFDYSKQVPVTAWLSSVVASEALLFVLVFALVKTFTRGREA